MRWSERRARRGKYHACITLAVLPAVVGLHSGGPPNPSEPFQAPSLPVLAWEGGPEYYEAFPVAREAGWSDPSFFPIGVWFESVLTSEDVELDRAAGINTYVQLTADSDITLVRDHGMFAITSLPLAGYGSETVGWLLQDEPDMWAGAGDAEWTGLTPSDGGDICRPADAECGYTVLADRLEELPANDGRMRHANFGKGVLWWYDEAEASRFVNEYTDIFSTDLYWYTDPYLCDEAAEIFTIPPEHCRLAANYGLTVTRSRHLDGLDGHRQPVWAVVEVGQPFGEGGAPIEPDQVRGAVISSLIHGARGIVYFNHNFGSDCVSYHVLRDQCGEEVRSAVTQLNEQLTELAPVLNSPSLDYTFNPNLNTMLKGLDGEYFVFAMLGRGVVPGEHELPLPAELAGWQVVVLDEERTVSADDGVIVDRFDVESEFHIYRITRPAS